KRDFLVITGDAQCQTVEGQYELSKKIIELAQKYNVKEIWTLGGFAIGIPLTRKPRVFTTTTNNELLKRVLEEENTRVTGGPVVGANGLVLGVGKLYGMDGGCLLGETPGFMPDPIASKEVLTVLARIQRVEWDLANLDELAKKAEEKAKKMAGAWEERTPEEGEVPATQRKQPSYFG
ncbi:MAG: PAC2 family protein, partial [Candidatus Wukongarchaeota archaeon]|nr:PAC2 family protein [Candidatus Wukongarchaeota archaeon]